MISDIPLTVGTQQYLCHIRIPNFTEPNRGLPKRMVVKPPQNCDTGAQNQRNQDNRRCSDFYLHQDLKNLRSSGSKTKFLQEAAGYCWNFSSKVKLCSLFLWKSSPKKLYILLTSVENERLRIHIQVVWTLKSQCSPCQCQVDFKNGAATSELPFPSKFPSSPMPKQAMVCSVHPVSESIEHKPMTTWLCFLGIITHGLRIFP